MRNPKEEGVPQGSQRHTHRKKTRSEGLGFDHTAAAKRPGFWRFNPKIKRREIIIIEYTEKQTDKRSIFIIKDPYPFKETMREDIAPYLFDKQTGKLHLRTICPPFYPWSTVKESKDSKDIGVFVDVFDVLSQKMNFTFSYTSHNQMFYGRWYPKNNSWTGSGGDIQNHRMEASLWALGENRGVRIAESEIVEFAICKIMASVGRLQDSNFIGFVSTFDVEIWYFLLALISVTIVVAALSDIILLHSRIKWKHLKKELVYYFWMFLSALFFEGSFRTPHSRRSQCLLGLWLLAMLILINAFCGQFKAVLMKKLEEPVLEVNEDLAERPDGKLYAAEGTYCWESYITNERPSYVKMREREQETKDYGVQTVESKEFQRTSIYQEMKEGKATLFFVESGLKGFLTTLCDKLKGNRRVYIVKEDTFTCHLNFAMNQDLGSKWLNAFSLRILWMREAAIIDKLIGDSQWNYGRCEDVQDDTEFQGITLGNLLPVFYLLFFVDAFAAMTLLGELIAARLEKKKQLFTAVIKIAPSK